MNLPTSLQRALHWASQDTRRWQVSSSLALALAVGLVACVGMDAGMSYDEVGLRKYGDMVIAWYTSGFKDASATNFLDLFYYGGLFEAFAQLIVGHLPWGLYESRHLITAFTALLGVVATWQLSARISGPRAGLIGALVLALTPCWSGHGLFNTKDIPFGTAAAFVSVASLRLVFGPAPLRVRDMCLAGVATGIALAVRPGGVFVLSYPCLAAAGRLAIELARRWRSAERLRPLRLAANLLLCVVLVVVITWPIMLATWPWAQLKPFENPFEAMRVASRFGWGGEVLFEGRMIKATELPLSYLPVWFRLTLPETYLLSA
ncbi:MAG TPA: hypothetical protein VJR89_00410 [Polyangiales bacterium]|nr:hypothetical protein [Polyangiales bacterium]